MRKAAGTLLLMIAGILSVAGSLVSAGQTDRDKALASLIEAERSFSRTSENNGIREAFLTFLAEKAIVFRPGPVEGRPVYEKMDPANPTVLTWAPEVAEISASGELGYASGPYQVRPGRGSEPTGFGHYVSIWKKQAATRGSRKALSAFGTDDIRVYRPGHFPSLGKRAFEAIIPSGAGRIAPGSERSNAAYHIGLAWSGDLAYSFGTFEISKDRAVIETTAYLRIWRKDPSGIWRICLDIELDVPTDTTK